jgi:hypothetical protein
MRFRNGFFTHVSIKILKAEDRFGITTVKECPQWLPILRRTNSAIAPELNTDAIIASGDEAVITSAITVDISKDDIITIRPFINYISTFAYYLESRGLILFTVTVALVDREECPFSVKIAGLNCNADKVVQAISRHIYKVHTTLVTLKVGVHIIDLGKLTLAICGVGPAYLVNTHVLGKLQKHSRRLNWGWLEDLEKRGGILLEK